MSATLDQLLVRIGETGLNLEQNLDHFVNKALSIEIPTKKPQILKTMFRCITELSVKTSVYASLVGLVQLGNPDFGHDVVDRAHAELQSALDHYDFSSVRLLVRFCAELAKTHVVSYASLFDLLTTFLGVLDTTPSETPDSLLDSATRSRQIQLRRDFFVYVVLAVFPWVGSDLARYDNVKLQAILTRIEAYLHTRDRSVLPALHVWSVPRTDSTVVALRTGIPHAQVDKNSDYLDLLYQDVVRLREDQWQVAAILRPNPAFMARFDAASVQHPIPPLVIPPESSAMHYPLNFVPFQLFNPDHEYQNVKSVDRWLVREYTRDILYHFRESHKLCAQQLQQMPVNLPKAELALLVAETLFGELLRLPMPPLKSLYYAYTLVAWCKAESEMHRTVGRIVAMIFERCMEMDAEANERFANWMALHLSSFDFQYPYAMWSPMAALAPDHPQRLFVTAVLERCIRLSYWDRIAKLVPDELKPLLPPRPHPDSQAEKGDHYQLVRPLVEALRKPGQTPDGALAFFETTAASPYPAEARLEIFMLAVLEAGGQPLSHLLLFLEMYLPALGKLRVAVADPARVVIKAVTAYWHNSIQMVTIVIERLLTYRVLDLPALVEWLVTEPVAKDFTKSYPWELLHHALGKAMSRVAVVERDLKALQENQTAAPRGVDRALIEEALNRTRRDLQALHILFFRRMAALLSAHLVKCEGDHTDYRTPWYFCATSRLLSVGRRYREDLQPCLPELREIAQQADPRLRAVFEDIEAIPPFHTPVS
ncbi:putative Nuclear cap-binding protein subunit 1 [Paratrimastix pyriformis]|uniref:Nuclear cap-binding protein subunit 1 n=1 Tax=Paratrimastix pyriformis TaxID=342808 RepID=A0ABQ8U6I2_9EUKA|nr:putative Nuclear cap-binding protein subunit 1 [Paratrimastix pyriformis]